MTDRPWTADLSRLDLALLAYAEDRHPAHLIRLLIEGVNLDRVREAMPGDPLAILAAYRSNLGRNPDEWYRDADGLQIGALAAILAWRRHAQQSVRKPSGLRQARKAGRSLPRDERKVSCDDMVALTQGGAIA